MAEDHLQQHDNAFIRFALAGAVPGESVGEDEREGEEDDEGEGFPVGGHVSSLLVRAGNWKGGMGRTSPC